MIDLNRGVTQSFHPKGFLVNMYDDAPGVYFTISGQPLSAEVAREAGFEIEANQRKRERQERLAAALAEVNREYGELDDGEVVAEYGGYRVAKGAAGTFDILDPEGSKLTDKGMSRAEAEKLAEQMAAAEGGSE